LAVGIQTVVLDFVVIATIHLVAKELMLEAVDMHRVDWSSWFELVKFVGYVWRRTKEAL